MLAELNRYCREEGHIVDIRVTWEHDDVERYTAEAIQNGSVDTVVAAGGDGTVNEVRTAWVCAQVLLLYCKAVEQAVKRHHHCQCMLG